MATKKKSLLKVGVGGSPTKTPAAQDRVGLPPLLRQALRPPIMGMMPAPGPGRPESNIGKYLIKPTAEMDSGYEMINSDPDVLTRVHKQYLKAGHLPPALQPKYIRKPEVMEKQRGMNISKGWRKPRSQQG